MRSRSENADGGWGCSAFGHLASPFIDGELGGSEQQRFATHLDSCRPCQALTAEYRAIDVAARTPAPEPSPEQWAAAWQAVAATVRRDREEAGRAPLAPVLSFARRLPGGRVPPALRPLLYAAAAVTLVAGLVVVQREAGLPGPPVGVSAGKPVVPVVARAQPAEVKSLACKSGYLPVLYTVGGDDPMTVIQCAYLGAEL